jgi:phosphatidylinositol glycan class C protein
VKSYSYWAVVRESGIIVQHCSAVSIFVAVFIKLTDHFSVMNLIMGEMTLTFIGYFYWCTIVGERKTNSTFVVLKGSILFFTTLLGLSPILKTLTEDTSDDTIWVLTICLFAVNILFHDYSSGNIVNINSPLSTNAAIFASVLLASRLPTALDVFGLMLFAMQWFALFPILRRAVRIVSVRGNVFLTIALVAVNVLLWSSMQDMLGSRAILTVYVLGVLFVTFLCPWWLIWIQRYKNEVKTKCFITIDSRTVG